MTPEQAALLRTPFPPEQVGKLPRKSKTGHVVLLDYVGHAEVTARLLDADPTWNWEPMAKTADGLPLFILDTQGNPVGLWIRMSVGGVERIGFGSVAHDAFEPEKQLISDAIRNCAMRFGVALQQWAKSDLGAADHVDTETGEIGGPAPDPHAWVWELGRTLKLHGLRVADLCEVIPVPEITRANVTAVVGHFLDAEGLTPAQLVQAVISQREARTQATVAAAAIVDPPASASAGPSLRDRIEASPMPDTDNYAVFDSAMADEMDRLGLSTADLARAIGTQATPDAVREYVTRTRGSASQLCEMAAEMKRRHVAAGKA